MYPCSQERRLPLCDIGGKSSCCSWKFDGAGAVSSAIHAADLARLTCDKWGRPCGPEARCVGLLPPECVTTEYDKLPLRTLPPFGAWGLRRRRAPSGRCAPHVLPPRDQASALSPSARQHLLMGDMSHTCVTFRLYPAFFAQPCAPFFWSIYLQACKGPIAGEDSKIWMPKVSEVACPPGGAESLEHMLAAICCA